MALTNDKSLYNKMKILEILHLIRQEDSLIMKLVTTIE